MKPEEVCEGVFETETSGLGRIPSSEAPGGWVGPPSTGSDSGEGGGR